MRTTNVLAALLAVICLGACSGGSGSPDDPPPVAGPGTDPGASPGSNPGTNPVTPALPPVATLTCSPCKKIAFVSTRDGNAEIYTVEADGSGLTRLTNNSALDGEPAWSPDGQRIAFTSDRDAGPTNEPGRERDLYVMDADGTHAERLTFSRGAWNPSWSPDGMRIAYAAESDGSMNLWQLPASGGTPELLFSTPGIEMQPAWSPDGSRLAVVSDWFAYDFVTDIFLLNVDGSGATAVTGNLFDQENYEEPAWSPDAGAIAVSVVERLGTDTYVRSLGVLKPNGSQLAILPTAAGTYVGSPSWSPDGTMIAYSAAVDGRSRIAWIRADATARGEIVSDGADPDWQR